MDANPNDWERARLYVASEALYAARGLSVQEVRDLLVALQRGECSGNVDGTGSCVDCKAVAAHEEATQSEVRLHPLGIWAEDEYDPDNLGLVDYTYAQAILNVAPHDRAALTRCREACEGALTHCRKARRALGERLLNHGESLEEQWKDMQEQERSLEVQRQMLDVIAVRADIHDVRADLRRPNARLDAVAAHLDALTERQALT